MAKAPDPLKVKADEIAKKAREDAEQARRALDGLVGLIGKGDDYRLLRYQSTTATMSGLLRTEAKVKEMELWGRLYDPAGIPPLDALAIGWWLAGMQEGVDGEPLDMEITRSDDPWFHHLTEDELAAVEADDDGPPA
jgi:hypothetical protein